MNARLKTHLKRVLPAGLVSLVSDIRNISPAARGTYLRLWASRKFRIRRDTSGRMPSSIRSILVVCHGNIIRSPMAAALLRRSFADSRHASISISSAGTFVQPGSHADARALQLSREFGVSLDSHQAQSLTPNLVEENDLILVMDYRNEAELLARFPEARSKVFMLKAVSAQYPSQSVEIPDPYLGTAADVRQCFETLKACTERIALTLSNPSYS